MIEAADISAGDRILLIGVPAAAEVRMLASRVARGMVVGIGPDDVVREARRALADLDNVMFLPAGERLEIPWQESFFTKVMAPGFAEAPPEIMRVLAPGGAVYLSASVVRRPSV